MVNEQKQTNQWPKMNKIAFLVFLACAVTLVVSDKSDKLQKECKFWKQMASNLSLIHQYPMAFGAKIYMQCHGGCSNITCSGNLKQPSLFGIDGLDMDFCFGMQLNHCEDPVRMQYYFQLPNKNQNLSYVGNITHNSTYELPVPSNLPMADNIKLIVFIEMVKVNHLNQSFVRFKISGKVRIMEGKEPSFPFQRTIFPETLIDIPDCPRDLTAMREFKPPKVCKAPPPPSNVPKPTTVPKDVIKSNTYHKACEIGLDKCNGTLHEMCSAIGDHDFSRNGQCECIPTASFNRATGYCEINHVTSIILTVSTIHKMTTPVPPGVTQATSASKNTHLIPIVVGSVAGVLVILVVGILVIVFIGRRKRVARYRDQQQLLSDDMMDEEDDTNGPI